MQPDLILRDATLPDGRRGVDILIADGLIQVVGPGIEAEARAEIDASGRLVAPPFVDCHFHMDATLSLGLPRRNVSGTLLEGIALWAELKPLLTVEAVVERALSYCDMAVAQGILAIRSHVDVCDDRLVGVEALLEVKRRVAPYLDLQLVAFPQDGLYRWEGARQNLLRALDMFGARPAKAGAILDAVTARQGQALRRAPETLFQPMRQGVDLEAEVEITTAVPRFTGQSYVEARGGFPKDLRKAIVDGGPYRNRDTGWKIAVSGKNLDHAVKRTETGKAGELPRQTVDRIEAVASLPALLERAVLIESRPPVKPAPTVAAIHRLYAPFAVDDRLYAVRLTVRERGARVVEVEGIEMFSAYDVALEKRVPAGTSPEQSPGPTADVLKVRTLLEGVKDDAGDSYFQRTPGGQPRGAITLHEDGRAVIELFETADASTVVHEAAHLFTGMMQDLAPHDAGIAADLKIVKDWTGAGDGPLLPAHHEKIATAFEAWVEGGAAPSGLEAAFRTLATFMARLFDGFRAQGRRATPEVEAVFERMLSVRPEARPKPDPAPADPAMASYDRLVREGRAHPDDIAEVEAWEREIARMGDLDAAYAQAAACVIAGLGAAA